MLDQGVPTREQAFQRLKELGVSEAVLEYNGSGDESNVDYILLSNASADEPDIELSPSGYGSPGISEQFPGEQELTAALEQPLYDEIGEDFGDNVPGVSGTLIWDVAELTVTLNHSYLDWQGEQKDL